MPEICRFGGMVIVMLFKGNILIKSNRCKEGCLCLQKMALFMHRSHAKSCA